MNNIYPYIDIKKTKENSRKRLEMLKDIVSSSGFYSIKLLKQYEIADIRLVEIITVELNNKSVDDVFKLVEIADRAFTENEKLFFYYYFFFGYSPVDMKNGFNFNNEFIRITNSYQLKKGVLEKMVYAIQEDIVYL